MRTVDAVKCLGRRVYRKLTGFDDEQLRRRADLSNYILARLQTSVEASGAQLMVMFIGRSNDGKPHDSWIETSITEFCRSNAIGFTNLAATMRDSDYASYYRNAHLNEEGHRLAADQLRAALFPEENDSNQTGL